MKIETKYEVGQRLWIVYEARGEVHLYDDTIDNIVINEKKELLYCTKEASEEVREEDVIPYDDSNKLLNKIKELLEKVEDKNK